MYVYVHIKTLCIYLFYLRNILMFLGHFSNNSIGKSLKLFFLIFKNGTKEMKELEFDINFNKIVCLKMILIKGNILFKSM